MAWVLQRFWYCGLAWPGCVAELAQHVGGRLLNLQFAYDTTSGHSPPPPPLPRAHPPPQDADVSIRKRALDLLFAMCNASNAEEVVGEMVKYLVVADFSMREELVLKAVILAEKFAPNVQWWVVVSSGWWGWGRGGRASGWGVRKTGPTQMLGKAGAHACTLTLLEFQQSLPVAVLCACRCVNTVLSNYHSPR